MAVRYSDKEIAGFLGERKILPDDYRNRIQLKAKRGHNERELDIMGLNGNEFRLILRQSISNPLGFSVILALCARKTNQVFRLRRYNGKNHEHTNRIEGDKFYDFHIHTATERYQDLGAKEDGFAEPTGKFSDFRGALQCMFEDCGFVIPQDSQLRLFEEH